MKNKAVFLSLILVIFLAMTACSGRTGENSEPAQGSETTSAESSDSENSEDEIPEEEKQAYEKAVSDFKEINMAELKKFEEDKKEAFIYAGALYCPYCRRFAPILDELAKKKNIDVYYLDAEKAGTDFDAYSAGKKVEYIPAIFYMNDGKSAGYDTYFFEQPFSKSDISNKIDKILQAK